MFAHQTQRTNNKTAWDVTHERDAHYARLYNYKNGTRVEMAWDQNERMAEDGIFIMRIGDQEAYLSAEEIRRFLRWLR